MGHRYEIVCRDSRLIDEKNDCTVKALAIACEIPYIKAHGIMSDYGREDGKGANFGSVMNGFSNIFPRKVAVKMVIRKPKGGKSTPKTIVKMLPEGDYICMCRGHVFALVDGVVEDWAEERQNHIDFVWRIVKL